MDAFMTSYLNVEEVKTLTIDINSSCNAACPGCARQQHGIHKNTLVPNNKHMSIVAWKKIIDEIGSQLHGIVFCGNYGDAGATKELPDFIDYAVNKNPNVFIIVTSNMGINSRDFWKRVVTIRPHNVLLQCSIDGLQDTNHIYRRFVKWEKVWENTIAAIEAGAMAEWKYIEFPWNSHQIETARELSKTVGFKNFIVTPNNNTKGNAIFLDLYNNNKSVWDDVKHWQNTPTYVQNLDTTDPMLVRQRIIEQLPFADHIECFTKKESSLHIDWNGHVWPCCWYGGLQYHSSAEYVKIKNMYIEDVSTGWNDINQRSLLDILDHKFFKTDLMDSLTNNPNVCCYESCGKCNNKYNVINTIGKMDQL